MGTKENPGTFDCYAAAEPDEPMFVLLARDVSSPMLVCMWAALRGGFPEIARMYLEEALKDAAANEHEYTNDALKRLEALECAQHMVEWRAKRHA